MCALCTPILFPRRNNTTCRNQERDQNAHHPPTATAAAARVLDPHSCCNTPLSGQRNAPNKRARTRPSSPSPPPTQSITLPPHPTPSSPSSDQYPVVAPTAIFLALGTSERDPRFVQEQTDDGRPNQGSANERTAQGRAGQGRAGQSRAGQGRAGEQQVEWRWNDQRRRRTARSVVCVAGWRRSGR